MRHIHTVSIAVLMSAACSGSSGSDSDSGTGGGSGSGNGSTTGSAGTSGSGDTGGTADGSSDSAATGTGGGPVTQSNIEHLVVILQENHTFDNYFGQYCTAAAGSNPTCTTGPECCEAAPATDPSGAMPITLDDAANAAYDPNHTQDCELGEMNGGAMDQYAMGAVCSNPKNIAYADPSFVKAYTDLAAQGALADRYFQPIVGQSSSNDMYFARASFVFTDNQFAPPSVGSSCELGAMTMSYSDPTIADLLVDAGVPWAWYGEGYQEMVDGAGMCPKPPADCAFGLHIYPCVYDPSDVPFQYYESLRDDPEYMRDYAQLADDLQGDFPSVVFVKGYGFHTEHPGYGDTITAGMTFVQDVLDARAIASNVKQYGSVAA